MTASVRRIAYSIPLVVTDENRLQSFALSMAPQAAAVANYCDHVEHNETVSARWVTNAAEELARLALGLADEIGVDLIDLYAERLGMIEARNVLKQPEAFDGHAAVLVATTWRDLQVAQFEHDRYYHPDVIGLNKSAQLNHYALHLAKIVGAFALARDAQELTTRRLPDALLFAIKLQTVMGQRLSDDALPQSIKRPAGARVTASR